LSAAQPVKASSPDEADPKEPTLENAVDKVNRPAKPHLIFAPEKLPPIQTTDRLERITFRAKPRESLDKILARFGIPSKESPPWLHSFRQHYPEKMLRPGQEVHLYFVRTRPGLYKGAKLLRAIEIELSEHAILVWEKGEHEIFFSKRSKPYDSEIKTISGVIDSSIAEDGLRAGLNSTLLSQLVDIFAWDLDFATDLRKGDTFKLVYERKWRAGQQSEGSFRILAADIDSQGQKYNAVYFERENGKGKYYDLNGRSLARAFLRFPLQFTGVSSLFSHSRFHPILKADRPHHGIDFMAKRGTPVRAVGDGKILFAGWKTGGYGRLIEIEHDSAFSSRYAHLQALAKGIRKGVTVKKGQIIGYVGSSGRTTGPHLHFEFYKDQTYVDPLNVEFPAEDVIEPYLLHLFENTKQLLLTEMDAAAHS
jgi:murein DD-endopeptidase MepM/ murein hydrolase activator NlpD